MISFKLIFHILLVVVAVCLDILLATSALSQTNVSGNQSGTWTLTGSPYTLIGPVTVPTAQTLTVEAGAIVILQSNLDITVASGATLSFGSNCEVKFGNLGSEIWVGSSGIGPGNLVASNVRFDGMFNGSGEAKTYINVLEGRSASLIGCTFRDGGVLILKTTATLQSCNFDSTIYGITFRNGGMASVSNITFGSQVGYPGIRIDGTISANYTLPNLGMPYHMGESINGTFHDVDEILVNGGALFTIDSGAIVRVNKANLITVGSSSPGDLIARGVTFEGIGANGSLLIDFANNTPTSIISNSVLRNVWVYCRLSSTPQIIRNEIFGGVIARNTTNPTISQNDFMGPPESYGVRNENTANQIVARQNYWGHATGPNHPSNPGGQGVRVTDGVDFSQFSSTPFGGGAFPLSATATTIRSEHPELADGKISPGEDFQLTVTVRNNTSTNYVIRNIYGFSGTGGVTTKEFNNSNLPFNLPAGQTAIYTYPVHVSISNWPSVQSIDVKFKVTGEPLGGQTTTFALGEVVRKEIYIPAPEKNLTLAQLQEQIRNQTIPYGETIATNYYPFLRINNCEGCNGLQAGALIVNLFSQTLVEMFNNLASDIVKDKSLDYVLNIPYREQNKYDHIWVVAGMNQPPVANVYSNLFHTNEPSNVWDVPKIGFPVRVIAKVKKLEDYTRRNGRQNNVVNLPLLEPLVFVYDTSSEDGYKYLFGLTTRPVDQHVKQVGIVHQYWRDNVSGNYYFSVVTVKDDPYDVPVVGSLFNYLVRRAVVRIIWKAPNSANVPELGSVVRLRGIYRDAGILNNVPLPSRWSDSRRQRWYVECDDVQLYSGSMSSLTRLEEEWFNTRKSEGPVVGELAQQATSADNSVSDTISAADLHVYDSIGRHTGVTYDSSGAISGVQLQIPGSFYASGDSVSQFVFLDTPDSTGYVWRTIQRRNGSGSLALLAPFVGDTLPRRYTINDSLRFVVGGSSSNYVNLVRQDSSGIILDSLTAKISSPTTTWLKEWHNNSTISFNVHIGELSSGRLVSTVNQASISLNGNVSPIPGSIALLDSLVGYRGRVLRASFRGMDAVNSLRDTLNGSYAIRLSFLLNDGRRIQSGYLINLGSLTSISSENQTPLVYLLGQVFPNPFNPTTTIN